jgi:hypothetical protein
MTSILAFALPVVIVIATLEGLLLAVVMRRNYNWRAYFASLADALGRQYIVLTFFTVSLAAPASGWAYRHHLFTIPVDTAVATVALLIGQDFCYYWFHRCSHRVRWFWATHAVHHSSNELNLAKRPPRSESISSGLLPHLTAQNHGFWCPRRHRPRTANVVSDQCDSRPAKARRIHPLVTIAVPSGSLKPIAREPRGALLRYHVGQDDRGSDFARLTVLLPPFLASFRGTSGRMRPRWSICTDDSLPSDSFRLGLTSTFCNNSLARVKESGPRFSFEELASRAAFSYSDAQTRRRSPLDGAEHGRRMHVPADPISSDRNTIDRSCLSLPLVPARDRDRACAQRSL